MTLIVPSSRLAPALMRRELHTGWSVRATDGPVPDAIGDRSVGASVPGQVHLDLLAAGLIPDPYLDDNEALLAWVGLVDWTYRSSFDVESAELRDDLRHDLVFEGVDTVAAIRLNGTTLAEVANQHRTYRFDVSDLLRPGGNELEVAFRSPLRHANEQSTVLGARPRPYPLPYEAIRKSACSFGWDWGIRTATSGLWRPVRLESWRHARLAQVLVHAEPVEDGGRVAVRASVERAADEQLTVVVRAGDAVASALVEAGDREAVVVVDLEKVRRWWPAGHGEQPLYDVQVDLLIGDRVLDRVERRVGFRTLRWNTDPDGQGTPFELVVNDRPIYVKGVNWIPDDAFFSRVGRARYRERLQQARKAHVNLVRVWGGGIYESDDFYDLCDELGLLTWQDFLFACAAYPEEEPLRSEIAAEARDNVARLGHHASLALFTGNNENLWGYEDWGWQLLLDGRTWGAHYYYELLPATVAELAPQVPYAPGSPFSPHGQHPNDERHGTTHLWEQWNRQDWLTYREHRPRFVAEFGWQGPPAWTTMTRSISDRPLTPESPGMLVHQKAMEGNTKLATGLVRHYRVPDQMADWHWAMQLAQATAVGVALDWFRSLPENAGAVVWQLNDCWPVTSWSAIDGDGREKPLLFALQNAFAPRAITVQPEREGLRAAVGNDTDRPWRGTLSLRRVGFDGTVYAEAEMLLDLDARGRASVEVPAALATPVHEGAEALVVELDDVRGVWYFAEARDSVLPAPAFDLDVTPSGDETIVGVTARTYLRELTLLIDRVDSSARVDRGLVTLLPGERAEFRVSGVVDADAIAHPGVVRTANELVVRR